MENTSHKLTHPKQRCTRELEGCERAAIPCTILMSCLRNLRLTSPNLSLVVIVLASLFRFSTGFIYFVIGTVYARVVSRNSDPI